MTLEEGPSDDKLTWFLKGYRYPARGKSADGDDRERYMQKGVQLLVDGEPVRVHRKHLQGDELPAGHTARIVTRTGFVGGKETTAVVDVTEGKNIGKSNETSPFEQALKEARSASARMMRKRDGEPAVDPESEHDIKPVVPAMLIKKNLVSAEELEYPIYIQPKLDGVRCTMTAYDPAMAPRLARANKPEVIAHAEELGVVAYSREYLIYPVWHLVDTVIEYLRARPNLYLDGELMAYDDRGKTLPLQTINGTARNPARAHQTRYKVFDIFDYSNLNQSFECRLDHLEDFQEHLDANEDPDANPDDPLVEIVKTWKVRSAATAARRHQKHLDAGYEGSVFREPDSVYVPSHNGHRSTTTIKWKPVHRMELEVVGWEGGKKGKAVDMVRWTLKVPEARGKKNTTTLDPKWPDEERRRVYKKLTEDPEMFEREYKGRSMTIEYQDISKDGLPLRAKAIAFRDYL